MFSEVLVDSAAEIEINELNDLKRVLSFGIGETEVEQSPNRLEPISQGYSLCHKGGWRYPDGKLFFRLWQREDYFLADCARIGQFLVHRTGSRLVFWHDPKCSALDFADYLHHAILSLTLELKGIICFHASCVSFRGKTFAFLGESGAGKSTLAAEFLSAGATLLSDDITPVLVNTDCCAALPMHPQLKLCQDTLDSGILGAIPPAAYITEGKKSWLRVGQDLGNWESLDSPLSAIYILDREDTKEQKYLYPFISPLPSHEACVTLLQNSYLAPIMRPLGLVEERMNKVAHLTGCVTVKKLKFANDLTKLSKVREIIQQDFM